MLAYSTIDQAGMMITALGIGGKLAAFALMLHMTFHTAAKSLLFLSSGNIYQYFKSDLFQKIRGGVLRVLPLERRRLLPGHDGDCRHAAVRPVSE